MNSLCSPLASRLRLLIALFGILTLIAFIAWLVFALWQPMPQRTLTMAMYPEGSLHAELVKQYRTILAQNGVDLRLVPSAGAVESVALMRAAEPGVSVALIPGGITSELDSPELVSLGTLFHQPIWVFSRGDFLQGHKHVPGLRISIGPQGSSSHALALKLLGRGGIIDRKSASLFSFAPSESAQ